MQHRKIRNADGMRPGPKTEAEWQAWNDFGLHENGRNQHMDIGDIIAQLTATQEEIETTTNEISAAQAALGEQVQALIAAKQRAESALSTLRATAGDSIPAALEEPIQALDSVSDKMDEDVNALTERVILDLGTRMNDLENARTSIGDYIDALLTSGG